MAKKLAQLLYVFETMAIAAGKGSSHTNKGVAEMEDIQRSAWEFWIFEKRFSFAEEQVANLSIDSNKGVHIDLHSFKGDFFASVNRIEL
ncbi:hypothetical protein IOC57_02860 [Bacillus sp. SD075]|uniref:hypothetical protein n=1 Tax=Bacillus sp. SD075 TaxID=2781732 RepID=UPI001A96E3FB|nr:hypothetical protein [Bacillus sp. SD075]MBO0996706.1 hypothetical protein [Bacillus sp. SD075]